MQIATAVSTHRSASVAVEQCWNALTRQLPGPPDAVIGYWTESHPADEVARALARRCAGAAVQGATSCQGIMTDAGFASADGVVLGIIAFSDPDGSYGVGAAEQKTGPRDAAAAAVHEALERAGRPGEVPALVWLNAAPGAEEQVLLGIADVLGPDVPVAGGSSADDQVAGRWSQLAHDRVFDDAVVVMVMFPSVEVAVAFHSGYEPSARRGQVTRAEGRILHEIDGQPAARVYDQWTGGVLGDAVTGGNVLSLTTLHPLGRHVDDVGGVPYYKLSHPERVLDSGSLTLFSEIATGDEVVLMSGSRESLITRAGRVAQAAMDSLELRPDELRGALAIYCAGCMLTVRDDIHRVADSVVGALGPVPWIGVFTFGEQGCFVDGSNSHGNLMISVVIFSSRDTTMADMASTV